MKDRIFGDIPPSTSIAFLAHLHCSCSLSAPVCQFLSAWTPLPSQWKPSSSGILLVQRVVVRVNRSLSFSSSLYIPALRTTTVEEQQTADCRPSSCRHTSPQTRSSSSTNHICTLRELHCPSLSFRKMAFPKHHWIIYYSICLCNISYICSSLLSVLLQSFSNASRVDAPWRRRAPPLRLTPSPLSRER